MKKFGPILLFLAIAFSWSWVNWFFAIHAIARGITETSGQIFIRFLLIGLYGPFVGAILTRLIFGGVPQIIQLLKKMVQWKAPPGVYITLLILPILIPASSIGLYAIFYGSLGKFDPHKISLVPIVLLASLRAGPLGEELGWRGFLLPEIRRYLTPLSASLVVGIVWASWHIPLFFAPVGCAVSGAPVTAGPVLFFYFFVACLSCIYTWLTERSNGSVLMPLLMHLLLNAGLLMLFFPGLTDQSRIIYYLSAPAYLLATIFLVLNTRRHIQQG